MKKQTLVVFKLKNKKPKFFSFPTKKAAIDFTHELKKIDKNIDYLIQKH